MLKRIVAVVFSVMGAVWSAGCGSIPPSSIEFVEVTPAQPKIGEIATIRFRAVDSRGEPMAGAALNFRIQGSAPGVTVSPSTVGTNKGTGIAETQVIASSRVSSVVVIAEAEGGKQAVSPPITFAGALPSAKQFTFQCGEFAGQASGGIHAIIAYDNSRSLVPGIALECNAHVGDRNGDGIADAQISFLTEAGSIGPTETSKSDRVGNAKILHKTSLPLPKEVAPVTFSWTPAVSGTQTGEYVAPLWMHPYDWITNPILNSGTPGAEPRRNDPVYELLSGRPRENNPRDNLVTMIAVTTGEEAFDDVNNNGLYDSSEPFTDTLEPFVDSNDNGTWDTDERFIDTNVNGRWDGRNGTYESSTLIWVAERILWTGAPNAPHDYTGSAPTVRLIQPATQPISITHLVGRANYAVIYADPWFNTIARNGAGDGCEVTGSDKVKLSTSGGDGKGILVTYPAALNLSGSLEDAHDPNENPPPPAFPAPGAEFTVDIVCTHTMSPVSQGQYFIDVGRITGFVQ